MIAISVRRLAVAGLVAVALAGCAPLPGADLPPTAAPATAAPATATPVSAAPTAAPASTATAAPAAAAIYFEPSEGGVNTQVVVSGEGAAPNSPVVVRLGLPNPVGEALTGTTADERGRWHSAFVMPDVLPSGELIPDGQLFFVAMDADTNQSLASAPFMFHAPPPPSFRLSAQTVYNLLSDLSAGGGDPQTYLTGDLRMGADTGRSIPEVLGLDPRPFASFEVGDPLGTDNPNPTMALVPATLVYDDAAKLYMFELHVEQGQWLIARADLASAGPVEQGGEPDPAAPGRLPAAAEAQAIGEAAVAALRLDNPQANIVAGAARVAGDYALALAQPFGGELSYIFLKGAATSWEPVWVTDSFGPDQLRERGLPSELLDDGSAAGAILTMIGRINDPQGQGTNGYLSVERLAEGYAKVFFMPADPTMQDGFVSYLRQDGDAWTWLSGGTAFAPEDLDALGVPHSVR